jgi:hypothetical protein
MPVSPRRARRAAQRQPLRRHRRHQLPLRRPQRLRPPLRRPQRHRLPPLGSSHSLSVRSYSAADGCHKLTYATANGQAAIALNEQFQTIKAGDACTDTAVKCAGDQLAQCLNGQITVSPCAGGLVCRALPLVNSAGTSVTCDTDADAKGRIAATGAVAKREHAEWERRAAFTLGLLFLPSSRRSPPNGYTPS